MGLDDLVMPFVDQANIACGFHGGDPLTIRNTLMLAKQHGVSIGAHPAYPDLVGFGRRSMQLSADELSAALLYQVSALDGMARCEGLKIQYVKPHGALYNDMMANADIRAVIMDTLADYHRPLSLLLQATPQSETHKKEAESRQLNIQLEAFADRCYDSNGALLSRARAGAVHNKEKMLAQVVQLRDRGTVTNVDGHELPLRADTLCVHGDNPEGVKAIQEIRTLLTGPSAH
ncbi:UNVERIFIED_CONTAM: hypothetical protein GTU68_034911 [Idotea baltica]|nr:hypothetical protein [Idotea baltica]